MLGNAKRKILGAINCTAMVLGAGVLAVCLLIVGVVELDMRCFSGDLTGMAKDSIEYRYNRYYAEPAAESAYGYDYDYAYEYDYDYDYDYDYVYEYDYGYAPVSAVAYADSWDEGWEAWEDGLDRAIERWEAGYETSFERMEHRLEAATERLSGRFEMMRDRMEARASAW